MSCKLNTVAEILTYVKCPHKYYMLYKAGHDSCAKPALSCVTGHIIDRTIKGVLRKTVYFENCHAEPVKQCLHNYIQEQFDFCWSKGRPRIRAVPYSDENLALRFCQTRIANWENWLWFNMKKQFIETNDWNQAYHLSKPMPENLLYDGSLGLRGRPDGFMKDCNGVIYPIDYKAGATEITPEIRLQMTYYALLTKSWTGRFPKYVKVLLLKDDWPEKSIRLTPWMFEDAVNVLDIFRERTQSDDIRDYPCMCEGQLCKRNLTIPEFTQASQIANV